MLPLLRGHLDIFGVITRGKSVTDQVMDAAKHPTMSEDPESLVQKLRHPV